MLLRVFGFVKETKRTVSYLIWNHVFVFFAVQLDRILDLSFDGETKKPVVSDL